MAKKTKPVSEAPPVGSSADLEAALGKVEPSAEAKAALQKTLDEAIILQNRITKGEELLKELKAQLHQLSSFKLPGLMAAMGTSIYVVDGGDFEGYKVEIKGFIAGTLPKDEEPLAKALEYIRSLEAGDIIKSQLDAQFGRGEDNKMGEIKSKLEELEVTFEVKTGVHPQTLLAFANERIKNGGELDLDKLGLHAGRHAKIAAPKVSKAKK